MIKITAEELKTIQLGILNCVAKFCDDNEIRYWLDCGTLLGAIRHKGYIPWDDDIDIGMLREDYDRFSKLFNGEFDRYQFVSVENKPDFYVPFGKVCDLSTVLYEPDEEGQMLSVNIDIFVYDNAPDDDCALDQMYNIRDRLWRIFYIQNTKVECKGDIIKYVLKLVRKFLCCALWPKVILSMVKNSKKYSLCSTRRVGNFTSFERVTCDKAVFSDFIDVVFEGEYYKAPIGYDEWLRCYYGEYMELPPVEKRISHHSFSAYYID